MFETLLSREKNIQDRFQSFYSLRIKKEHGGLLDVEQPPGLISHFKRQLLSKSLWIIFPSKEQRIILLMVSVQQQ